MLERAGCVAILVVVGNYCTEALARKTNQAVYEEPFDLAAGGAALTRASQEGVMFANPALMPWGLKFHRWAGTQSSIIVNREAQDLTKSSDVESDLVDRGLKARVHAGVLNSTSWVTNNFGIGAFGRFEPDLEVKEFGASGLPALKASAEGYGGGIISGAKQVSKWFSLGISAKGLYSFEPDFEVSLTDETRIKTIQKKPRALLEELGYGKGYGFDLGSLIFVQGKTTDFRLALKIDDVGDTRFQGTQAPFKQTIHAGTSLTFHNATEALHLSLDFRDVQGVYDEKIFKRVYTGVKLLLRNYVGLAAGFYQGIPSAGIRLDFVAMKLGFTAYSRELGNYVGEKQRNLYVFYVAFGY